MLWKEICGNALLSKTTLILFLNKVRGAFRTPICNWIRRSHCAPLFGSRSLTHCFATQLLMMAP